ncbi:sterol desaturase family protein [Saprospiraceae bacterium]|jgi:beta-carotene 3-hydroxylase|nr:sterol desaturase family protein [Bacteroidota bacterium]MDB4728064.1 sterol desaturase family protein [Saprospiraceae bacterium]MDF1866755.1 sterol desaturase family protein [Saprospiraceae bacterium]
MAISITVGTFLFMEGVAWFTHKYIMHGLFWHFHEDHHTHDNEGFFEKNDFFFLIFAIPGITLTFFGGQVGYSAPWFWMGLGITLYGFAYFMVHDIFIHQRFKIFTRAQHPYLRAIRRAHKVHHKKRGKEDGECFGMLWVPFRYLKEAYIRR